MSPRRTPMWIDEALDIALTPWQEEILQRILAGQTIAWPRRSGRSMIMHYLAQRLRRNGKLLIHKGGKP